MRRLFVNKNPAGKFSNILMGLAEIVDGLVRILSLGYLATTLPLDVSRYMVLKNITKMKANRLTSN